MPAAFESVEQVRARLVLSARAIILDHWPASGKQGSPCPVCNAPWMCWPMRVAYAYLRVVGQHVWSPPKAPEEP